jgi:hypothetical protein
VTYKTCKDEFHSIAGEGFESVWLESEGIVLPDENLKVTSVGKSKAEKDCGRDKHFE